ARTENRPQANSLARQGVRAALLAVDDADRRSDDQTDLTQRLNRLEQGPAGGDDVLDETHAFPSLVHAFDSVRRPILLRAVADDQEREPGRERARRGERNGAEFGRREPGRLRLELPRRVRDSLAERS